MAQMRAELDARRGTAASRGYDSKWRGFRSRYLRENPLCLHCQQAGRLVPATEVDHIIALKQAPTRRFDRTNLQPLCKPCHSRKTAAENGSFGRG